MKIRQANMESDLEDIRDCIIELQDFEKQFDPRMPSGDSIADEYVADMLCKIEDHAGRMFVAADNKIIAGYAAVLARVSSGDLDDGDLEFAVINDLMVREQYRGQGIGKQLIAAAERFARTSGARWLRLSVLAKNHAAKRLYESLGYSALYTDLEKEIEPELPEGQLNGNNVT